MQTELNPEQFPALLKVPEAAKLARTGKQTIYNYCHVKGFPCVKLGRNIRIPREAFMRWLDQQAGA
ncbi:Helix-turn-helix domain protein [Pelotomaculum schinkii]|uniref:Helix-turn-helix domain protein n=1 Tax=Pelotomaculum schinkii TaxID=78350 RepID=A0A4Y7RIR2_9FIRM|nr:helix-turn-helix domain-containing protein [Pelotomaculum schinkii]TEB08630.1 Helix-turn-helix domain protein [Pelotomaculum schinkii]